MKLTLLPAAGAVALAIILFGCGGDSVAIDPIAADLNEESR